MKKLFTNSIRIFFLLLASQTVGYAQIASDAVLADPSASTIYLSPISSTIAQTATMCFDLENASVSSLGRIPANSVYVTLSFPAQFGIATVPTIPGFDVVYTELGPSGTMHLINNVQILPGDVLTGCFPIRAYALGPGTATYNVDRTLPITVANTLVGNDNASVSPTVATLLPLRLLSFAAVENNCINTLNWSTADEVNTHHFDIEYSTDAVRFNSIANLPAQGNGSGKTYSYKLNGTGVNGYYRLKMVDIDGKFTYSSVLSVRTACGEKAFFNVYPNPVMGSSGQLYVNYKVKSSGMATISFTDATGKQLLQRSAKASGQPETVQLNIGHLPAGIYFVQLMDNEGHRLGATQKVIKK